MADVSQFTVRTAQGEQLKPVEFSLFSYADPQSHTFKTRLELPQNSAALVPGMWVKTEFNYGQREVLVVPSSAVLRRAELSAVYRVNNGQRALNPVRLGQVYGDYVEVLSGLELGDVVATQAVTAKVNDMESRLGISGRIAAAFQNSAMTPLLALVGLLMGLFAVMVTPKEEEPQIDVTFADVYIPFPGASPREVESLVTTPAEQVISEIEGIDKIYSFSQPDGAMIVAIFKVGVPRNDAVVRIYNKLYSNKD